MAKLTLSIILRRIWKNNVLIPHLRYLLSYHAPRIQGLEIKEFLGNDSLFPLDFHFSVLETVRIHCVNVDRVNPDYIFSLPTSLKSLQVKGPFPRIQPTGSPFRPLFNIKAASLQILKVSTHGNHNDLEIDNLPRYSDLRHLELLTSTVPKAPAIGQPLRLPPPRISRLQRLILLLLSSFRLALFTLPPHSFNWTAYTKHTSLAVNASTHYIDWLQNACERRVSDSE
ncbi:hypothetical protein DL93DRAFT_1999119 [Clavulina sp. PMI_390]|nr:hypothetical protein DL93DRAFT_1999119 [Clavulina sp. PMI_390]